VNKPLRKRLNMLLGILLGALVGFVLAVAPGLSPFNIMWCVPLVHSASPHFIYGFIVSGYTVGTLAGCAKETYTPRTSGMAHAVLDPDGLVGCERSVEKLLVAKVGGSAIALMLPLWPGILNLFEDSIGPGRLILTFGIACLIERCEPRSARLLWIGGVCMTLAGLAKLGEPVYLMGLLLIMLPNALINCGLFIQEVPRYGDEDEFLPNPVVVRYWQWKEGLLERFGIVARMDKAVEASVVAFFGTMIPAISPESLIQLSALSLKDTPESYEEFRIKASAAQAFLETMGLVAIGGGYGLSKSVLAEGLSGGLAGGAITPAETIAAIICCTILGCSLLPVARLLIPERELKSSYYLNLAFIIFNIVMISGVWLPVVLLFAVWLAYEQVMLINTTKYGEGPVLGTSLVYVPSTAWLLINN
jgi:hypothetical protein